MKFSVIIPAYNIEDYIEECVNSVLEQVTTLDFSLEILIVNDGSNDQTSDRCEALAAKQGQIKVLHKMNGGLSSARNHGLQHATGDYTLFLDGDDFWADKYFLQKLHQSLSHNRPDLIMFSYSKYYKSQVVPIEMTVPSLEGHFDGDIRNLVKYGIYTVSAWNKCVKTSLIKDNNLSFPEGRLSEDCLWSMDLIKYASSYDILPSTQYMYRQGRPGSITSVIKEKNILDILESIEIGLKNCNDFSENRQQALLAMSCYFYLATVPSLIHYQDNVHIVKLVRDYLYLTDYIDDLGSKNLKLRHRLVRLLGPFKASAVLAKLKVMRNSFRKLVN